MSDHIMEAKIEALHPYDDEMDTVTFMPDDGVNTSFLSRQMEQMFESVTRIGGEVSKLRNEVDDLLDQNSTLIDMFKKLRAVIEERGQMVMDDFELACEVFDEVSGRRISDMLRKKCAQ